MGRRGQGSLYLRGRIWWLKFYRNGRPIFESSRSRDRAVALRLLRLRLGDAERGVPFLPVANRFTFDDAVRNVVEDYRVNQRKSTGSVERRVRLHLAPHFGGRRLIAINTSAVKVFINQRIEQGASNAEINRELAILKRAYSLALKEGLIYSKPHIPALRENNVRTGFLTREQFAVLHRELPPYLKSVLTFGYVTGWRRGEVLGLEWSQVDFTSRTVKLHPGQTKNGEGRTIVMTGELETMLRGLQQSSGGSAAPFVFLRNGNPIKDFRSAWDVACQKAGCHGLLFHDLRRSAVRNFVRAGISTHVARKLSGHKTQSVFDRYDITDEDDLVAAAAKLERFGTR